MLLSLNRDYYNSVLVECLLNRLEHYQAIPRIPDFRGGQVASSAVAKK
jgi:hypothetical protein